MGIGYLLFVKKDKLIYNNWILYCSLFTLLFVNIYLYCAKVLLSEGIWQNVYLSPLINIPQAILFLLIAINIPQVIIKNKSIILREMSSSIYFLHRYFIYYLLDPILGVESYFIIKSLVAIIGFFSLFNSQERKIKPLMFVLNIKIPNKNV